MFEIKLSIQSRNGLMETIILVEENIVLQISHFKNNELYYFDKNLKIIDKISLPVGISMEFSFLMDNFILSRDFYTAKPFYINLKNKSFEVNSVFKYDFNTSSGGYKSFYPIMEIIDFSSPFNVGLFDFVRRELKWKTNISSNLYFLGEFLIGYLGPTIFRYSIETGEILWRFDISSIVKELEVSRLVGVCDGILVAGIGDEYMIGINTENGELVWKIETDIASHSIIDSCDKKIRCIISRYYFEIDLKTGSYSKIQYAENDDDFDSQRSNYVLVGDHIITTDWKRGRIGAFNTITHRFDWLHDVPGVSFPAGQAMKYLEPYLFVMDSKQVLHIFKKE